MKKNVGRLRALDRVLIVDDEGRNARDAHLRGVLGFRANHVIVGVVAQAVAGSCPVHPGFDRRGDQRFGVADVFVVEEVATKEDFGERVLMAALTCPVQDAVGIDGVGHAIHRVELEGNAARLARLGQCAKHSFWIGFGAELLTQVVLAVDTFFWCRRIELVRMPHNLDVEIGALGQGGFQTAFADEAPRANGV